MKKDMQKICYLISSAVIMCKFKAKQGQAGDLTRNNLFLTERADVVRVVIIVI